VRVRFVHAADLHLDAPFVGLREADEEVSARLREATFRAYDRVIDLCLKERVDFAVFAGDVFNSQDRSLRAQVRFLGGLSRLAQNGIPALVAHGNHDPLSGWSPALEWPGLAHRFADQVESVPIVQQAETVCRVHGVSFPRRDVLVNLARSFRREAGDAPLAVGVLHTSVGTHPEHAPYAPCSVDDLRAAGFDYWALGHIHARQEVRRADPCVVYSGNTQGLNPNEPGVRGCYVVTLEQHAEPRVEFRPTSVVEWRRGVLSIADLPDEQALIGAAERLIESVAADTQAELILLRLRLEGMGGLHGRITPQDLTATLRDFGRAAPTTVWVESLELETRPPLDLEGLAEGDDFVGEFLRLANQAAADEEMLAELRGELAPLINDPEVRRVADFTEEDLRRWVERARIIGAEGLVEEREA